MRTNRLGKYFQMSINDLMFSNRASTLLSHAAEATESLPPPLNLKTHSFTGSEEGWRDAPGWCWPNKGFLDQHHPSQG